MKALRTKFQNILSYASEGALVDRLTNNRIQVVLDYFDKYIKAIKPNIVDKDEVEFISAEDQDKFQKDAQVFLVQCQFFKFKF